MAAALHEWLLPALAGQYGSAGRRFRRLALAVLVVGGSLGGCVAPEPASQEVAAVDSGSVQDDSPPPPRTGLSKDILYRLLVGEFASHRGDLPLSLESYLDVARETRDAGVAARAAKLAVFARAEAQALEAARLWSEASPSSVEARQVLASLLVRAGDMDAAVEQFRMIVEALSSPPGAGFERVSDLLSAEEVDDFAVTVMRRLVAGREDDAAAQRALGRLLVRSGRTEEASPVVDRAYALDPDDAPTAVLRARLRHGAGDVDGAFDALVEFIERVPDSGLARMAYAQMLYDASRYDQARTQFEHLVAREPENDDARYALALLLVQTDRLDAATEHLERLASRGSRRHEAHYYLGRIAESRQRLDDAVASYRRVRRGEHRLNAQIRIAVLYAERGDLDAARRHLHGLRSGSAQEAVRIYRAEAGLLTNAERYDQAMAVFDESLDEFPGNPDLLYSRGMLAERMDRLDIVERDMRAIIARDPDHADALNALGYTLADRTDRYEEAYELIKRAIALKPDEAYIVDSMGWVLYRLGRYQEALVQLRRAMSLDPDPEIAAHLGEVLWVLGEEAEAREVWRTALEVAPDDERLQDVIKRFGL